MLNFRKLRQDFSSNILKEGKSLYEGDSIIDAKIVHLDNDSIRLSSRVKGTFENVYESEVEIDRHESCAVDSNCDCTYTYDCQHIAAFLFFLEKNLNEIVVDYSKEANLEEVEEEEKEKLQQTFEEAGEKEDKRKDATYQKEVLCEYVHASKFLGSSAFFLKPEKIEVNQANLAVILNQNEGKSYEVILALRLSSRSKPLYIPNIKGFLLSVRYKEPIQIAGKRFLFTLESFSEADREILTLLLSHVRVIGLDEERNQRVGQLSHEAFGILLAKASELGGAKGIAMLDEAAPLPCLYAGNLEEPLCFAPFAAQIQFTLEYLEAPGPTLLLKPAVKIDEEILTLEEAILLDSTAPGVIYKNIYYRFPNHIKRIHLNQLTHFQDLVVPEPHFGSFIENSLPILRQFAHVTNPSLINRFVTLPFVGEVRGRCVIQYLDGELDAEFFFLYDEIEIPASAKGTTYEAITKFIDQEGILARDLTYEKRLLDELFEDFILDEKEGLFRVKSEKKIVEFMTEIIPRFQEVVTFECPENLSEQFIYDETTFSLKLSESDRVDSYLVDLKVDGHLNGLTLDVIWDCVAAKKRFVELDSPKTRKKGTIPRILVLDLEKIKPIIQLFDEIGIATFEDHREYHPLWSLTTIHASQFKELPIKFSMTAKLKAIQKQIVGETLLKPSPIPKEVQTTLRTYQEEGVFWLEKLRRMHLGGILADDMGLGKTVQAVTALTQLHSGKKELSLIICPTSLVYNWKAEFNKFNPNLKILIIDSTPAGRKKMLENTDAYDILVTSYNLLQKDIEHYQKHIFGYVILDEAQHIKNRGTRNAKSVKLIKAQNRLILTGTPIENSLDELWSLFDFLMPGLLSSYERFVEKYIRKKETNAIETLRRKVTPFILRRMKEDVIDDLPPVSEIEYHCHLSGYQQELYESYAASAKEELSKLVAKEGFDKVQIHVLATLTRLKQICCHPAIFAKEKAEVGDSAKYDMLMELLPSLIEGNHKTVIFSQYTKMLGIMKLDLQEWGIPFAYLDGSSKNRLDIVNKFNEDPSIPVFLVSLKAGGVGLNLVGADTVIHYDMWWNPAIENQATDRVHRIGQKKSVSSYKLVTLNSIEEKILNLQKRKQGLVKKVINSDDEAIAKLTWEEVLELLQT
ncbi:MAG: RNA polymerase-associated protein RapA [Chlamydiales bacterium]|nr:RNA polymerase-associated protein RapA [Chlamydiales bacterium]MCH9619473.1 RNA polymerase-associated protein RapA [Chlamydiales bacterium]MCH9622277.1 RNA polymerase-associated protein RapA [Chlamydiales bacterium]